MKISFKFSPLFILFFVACGQQTKANKKSQSSLLVDEGIYRARIIPVNRQFQKSTLMGEVTSKIDVTKANFQVEIKDLSASMIHPQYIHSGTYCPTESDDLNSDGVIDISEAQKAMGPEIIALENNEKIISNNQFPQASAEGDLFYLKTFSIDEIKNYFYKSVPNFNISKMSYLILGVGEEIELPETIKGIAGMKKQTSLPVGCGIFEKIQIESPTVVVSGDKN